MQEAHSAVEFVFYLRTPWSLTIVLRDGRHMDFGMGHHGCEEELTGLRVDLSDRACCKPNEMRGTAVCRE